MGFNRPNLSAPAEAEGKNGGIAYDPVGALMIAFPVVIGNGRLESHTNTHGKHGKEHSNLAGHALGCQRYRTVADHNAVGDNAGDAV